MKFVVVLGYSMGKNGVAIGRTDFVTVLGYVRS